MVVLVTPNSITLKLDSKFFNSASAFSVGIHEKITEDALPFLKPEIMTFIKRGHMNSDMSINQLQF